MDEINNSIFSILNLESISGAVEAPELARPVVTGTQNEEVKVLATGCKEDELIPR